MTQDETQIVLANLSGIHLLIGRLLYGCGLRLMECPRLRVKDVEFSSGQIVVRNGKGFKDRITILPDIVIPYLKEHLVKVKSLHEHFLKLGFGSVELPYALAKKYPNAQYEWKWQYVFPAKNVSTDPRSGAKRRHHIYESTVQRAVKQAVRLSGIAKHVGCHTLRHCFATHLLESRKMVMIYVLFRNYLVIKT